MQPELRAAGSLDPHLWEFRQGEKKQVVPGEIDLAKPPAGKSASKIRKRALVPVEHRKPTMSDVARLAGVGTMTVSRVLSGTVRVSADTTQRVQTAIEQLKYRPNVLARAFRGQRSHSIGLILPYLYDPFFAGCAHAVTTVAREHGYSVIITTSDEDPETEFTEADEMLQRHVDGLLVIPARIRQSRLTRSLFGKTPVVAFDRPVPDPSIDTVLVQNAIGSRRITEHLIEHGHKHITFIALSRSLFTISTRFAGYRRAMQDAGLEVSAIFDCNSEEIAEQILKEKMGRDIPPTAVVTSNTLVTRYVLGAISRLGLRVPNDLAFAGFDDFDLAEFTSPPLTVVRQPAQEMGRVAANLLFDRIARGEMPHTGNRIVLPVEIVLRRSCGCKHRTAVVIH
jgi:LacI family transcriptional regulator